MNAKAISECETAIEKHGRQPSILAPLGFALAASGKRQEAEAIANELETSWSRHYFSPVNLALVHTALGNKDRAFFWLSKGVEARDPQMIWLRVEPQLESIRADPRMQALFQRMENNDEGVRSLSPALRATNACRTASGSERMLQATAQVDRLCIHPIWSVAAHSCYFS
jgi:hypothetical protein